MRYYLILAFLVVPNVFYGQIRSSNDTLNPEENTFFHLERGTWMYYTETSLGIVPTLSFGHQPSLGTDFSIGHFVSSEGGASAYVAGLGYEYLVNEDVHNIKSRFFTHHFALIIGANLGLSANYYLHNTESAFALKPEIGIGFFKLYFNYGRNIFIGNSMKNVPKNTFSVSCFLRIHPRG